MVRHSHGNQVCASADTDSQFPLGLRAAIRVSPMMASLTDIEYAAFTILVNGSGQGAQLLLITGCTRPHLRNVEGAADHDRYPQVTRVVVIGAGLAGLSAACHLTGHGYDVTVVERKMYPADGPASAPRRLHLRHRADGADHARPDRRRHPGRDAVIPTQTSPTCCRCAGWTRPTGPASPTAARSRCGPAARRCGRRSPRPAAVWTPRRSSRSSTGCAGSTSVEMPNFIDRNFDSPLDLLSSPRALARLLRLGAFGRLGAAVRRRFRDPRLHRLFSFQAMYAGLAPESALALYAVITYMDSIEGVWFPEGGMHAVPMIMAQAAEKAGVTFRYGDAAEEMLRSAQGRVAGVRTASGDRIVADAVVCTLDLPTAYQQFLGDLRPPRAVRSGNYSPSAVVWHVGVRGLPPPRPPTTTSTSAPSGAPPSTRCSSAES